MVGRGVPAQRGGTVLAAEGADPTTPDDARADALADTAATPAASGKPSASPSSRLGLSYPERLEEPEPVAEEVPAGAAREPFATTAVAKVPPPPANAPAKPATSKPRQRRRPPREPAPTRRPRPGPALLSSTEWQRWQRAGPTHPRRLAKGLSGVRHLRVRIPDHRASAAKCVNDADTVAAKLGRDEQFKPWVTR
jgi:hypothetical protein